MRIAIATALLSALFAAGPLHAQNAADLLAAGHAASEAEQWAVAEELYGDAFAAAEPAARNTIAFFRGFAAYKQGEELARSNTQGDLEIARTALGHFERAQPFLEASAHGNRAAVEQAVRQYIANQRAIIEAVSNAAPPRGR